jgi:transcriptional regulator with XRE-family HTH domain
MKENGIGNQVGPRLKFRRKETGMTLRQLSDKTGLTASFLSQVERGVVNVSWRSLQSLAEVLGVPYLYFLSEDETLENERPSEGEQTIPEKHRRKSVHYSHVIRNGSRPTLSLRDPDVNYELLVPSMNQKMVAFLSKIAPGTGNTARRLQKSTEEFIFIVSGALKIVLDTAEYVLYPGDSIYFEGDSLQNIHCASEDEEVTMISVITPAVY